MTLDQVIKVTNRRVNALEHIVIPKFQRTLEYIKQEIDEMSREDYFRLKKVLDNKKKVLEAEKKEAEKRAIENAKAEERFAEANPGLAKKGGSKKEKVEEDSDEDEDSGVLKI